MAYNSNIPQASDVIADSQSAILANFQAIQTLIAVNHATFGDVDEGKHKWISCPVQASVPSFVAGEDGLYNKLNATTAKNEMYVHKQTFSSTAEIPWTASFLSQIVPDNAANGWTYLPSGLILRWTTSVTGTGLTTITLGTSGSVTYPSFTKIFGVLLTPYSPSTSDVNFAVRLVSVDSATQFKVYFSSRTSTGSATGSAQAFIIGY